MVTLIPKDKLEPQWHTVAIANGQTIRLKIKRPTPADVLTKLASTDSESAADYTLRRINLLIVDWDGVNEESTGQPVPYTFDTLVQLLTQIPSAIWAVSNAVNSVMHGLSETERKNSPTPPADGGTITPVDPLNSSGSSDYQMTACDEKRSVTATA